MKYSEQWDAYYDETTNEWTESKCSDPTCEYCAGRPEKPMNMIQELSNTAHQHALDNIEYGENFDEVRDKKFAELLIESIVVDLEQFKSGYDDRAVFNLHEMVGRIQERIRGI